MKALVIDDDIHVRSFISEALIKDGLDVSQSGSAEHALQMMGSNAWDMVFCDVMLGGETGFTVLRRFREHSPSTPVVLMTGHGSAAGALDAASFGAYDYLLKPFGLDEILSLSRAIGERLKNSRRRVRVIHKESDKGYKSDVELVGRSGAFIEVLKQVGRVAQTHLPTLITGESGTGKEVIASTLHRRSHRAKKPFVTVNCGAIPAELIESELFGHVRGSFTGADRNRPGLWEEADGGTIFLDEITETSPAFQVKLLRVLQTGESRRVGSNQVHKLDVRVIAASNRDVEKQVEMERFRQDLFYRLNAVNLHLPPLRERKEDILLLAGSFAERCLPTGSTVSLSQEAQYLLEQYPWPGNVRELENAVMRAVALCDGVIRPNDLPEKVREFSRSIEEGHDNAPATNSFDTAEERWPTLSEVERDYLERVLRHTNGNRQAASRILTVDRKTIDRMIKRHKIAMTVPKFIGNETVH